MSNLTPAERQVRKLARLPENCICPNCGLEKPKFGFGNVCVKFHTFVCNDCKSSHQAISHRCKSITMSSWTNEEVAELAKHGNNVARQTWLHRAPQPGTQGRPKPGSSDISVYKTFVVDVYERRKYYGEATTSGGGGGGGGGVPEEPQPAVISPAQQQPAFAKAPPAFATAPKVSAPRPVIAPVSAPTADLLDFFSEPSNTTPEDFTVSADFGDFQAPVVSSSASEPSIPDAATTAADSFTADFGDFQVAPPVVSFSAPAPLVPPPHKTTTNIIMTPMTTMNPQSATISNMTAPTMMNRSSTMQGGMGMNGMMYSNGNSTVSMNSGMPYMMPNGMSMNGAMSMNSSGMPMSYGMSNMNGMMNHGFARNGMNGSNTNAMNNGFASNGMNSGMNNAFTTNGMKSTGMSMNGPNGNGMSMNGMNNNNNGMVMNPPPPMNHQMAFPQNGMTRATKSDPFADLRPFQS